MIRLALLALLLTGCAVTPGQRYMAEWNCAQQGKHTLFVVDKVAWMTWFAYCEGKKAE